MKIVQVMPDFGLAGAETMVENLTCGLAAEGHDVLVISFFDLHTAITERIESIFDIFHKLLRISHFLSPPFFPVGGYYSKRPCGRKTT